jgi:hypothetical protein
MCILQQRINYPFDDKSDGLQNKNLYVFVSLSLRGLMIVNHKDMKAQSFTKAFLIAILAKKCIETDIKDITKCN